MIDWGALGQQAEWEQEYRRLEKHEPPNYEEWITVNDALRMSGRSIGWVRSRIDSGRINVWKHPVSGRIFLLLEDVRSQIRVAGIPELPARPPSSRPPDDSAPSTQHSALDPQDLDDEPWSAEIEAERQYQRTLAEEEAARQAFAAKQKEIDDWVQSEMRKLELAPRPAPIPRRAPSRFPDYIPPVLIDLYDDDEDEVDEELENEPAEPASPPAVSNELGDPTPDTRPPTPCPIDATNVWIGPAEAASLLGLSKSWLRKFGALNGLDYRQPAKKGLPGAWRLHQVLDLAARRGQAADTTFVGSEAGRRSRDRREFIRRWAMEPMRPGDQLITAAEAARLLGIAKPRISILVTQGKLWGFQKDPGKPGSRLFFRLSHISEFANRPDRLRRRRIYEETKHATKEFGNGWEPRELEPYDQAKPSKSTQKDRGEFYTSRQAALVLGIRNQSVHELRMRGRLQGYLHNKKTRRKEPARVGQGRKWWFYKKQDVDDLLADSNYQRGRRSVRKYVETRAPTADEIERQWDECVAIARENERNRQRRQDEWDLL